MSQYVHPEFGIFCPTPRLRRRLRVLFACAAVAAIGLAVMATADSHDPDGALVVATVDEHAEHAGAEAIPSQTFAPVVIGTARRNAEKALTDADKPSCVGDTSVQVDGKCAVSKPRKPRMVRVPIYRPAIASVPLGRTTALMGATETNAAAVRAPGGRQGDAPKAALAATSDAAVATATEPAQPPAATRKKKTVRSQQRRRDPYGYYGYGYDRWREVRVDEWSGRAPRQRAYPRGGYGQGSFRSFW